MSRSHNLSKESGFSLIEILVALAIFALGSLAVVSLHYTTTGSLRGANETTEAVLVAQNYLNQTLDLPYRDDADPTGCIACMKTRTIIEGKYTVNININPNPPAANSTAVITITVTWPRVLGISTGSYSLQYVRAETRNTTGL